MIRIDGVDVPVRIGHNYRPMRVYSKEYIESERGANHRRLHVFHHKGCACSSPGCTQEGHYVIVGKDARGGVHVDLYTKDFTLMTVDHIYPKAKGGEDTLENKQPMCDPCNVGKGAKVSTFDVHTRAPILQH